MKLIESPITIGPTTIQKVSYKGDIWERTENSKLIDWSIYSENTKTFMYRCVLSINKWHRYVNDCTSPEDIEQPYVEKSYQNLMNPLKLYKFELECFYTTLYGLFVATEQEVQSAIGKTLYFGQVDKDREVSELFSWFMLHELKVREKTTLEDLLEANGRGNFTISGYNPLDYLEHDEEELKDE
jgi:hypothetical protein